MADLILKINHPHISRKKTICNNTPVIKGTRTPVRSIVNYHRDGLTPEEIIAKLPYLKIAEIYDALSFYYDNKKIIDKEINENKNEKYWESKIVKNKK